jgi:SAM-dependent methyltransferase
VPAAECRDDYLAPFGRTARPRLRTVDRRHEEVTVEGKQRLYNDLAAWWPLLSPPEEYGEEAAFYAETLAALLGTPAPTLLELGSGGGSNAFHMKRDFALTLVDLAPGMLAVSQRLNPECEHLVGDMRSLRLGRQFDAVFVHDAICYMTTLDELRQVFETAYVHCRPGGAALFAPDYVRESFHPRTGCGGADADGRGLRYLEWAWDPDPEDTTYIVDYAFLLREPAGSVRVEQDRHVEGLFSRADWLRLLGEVGFEAEAVPFEHSELPDWPLGVFVGRRPARAEPVTR